MLRAEAHTRDGRRLAGVLRPPGLRPLRRAPRRAPCLRCSRTSSDGRRVAGERSATVAEWRRPVRSSEDDRASLDDLKRHLANNAEALGRDLFGEPSSRSRRELRWGRRGGLSIAMGGKAGAAFYSFEAAEGGSLLDAIMFAHGCGFTEAVAWARSWLGDDVAARPRPVRRQVVAPAVDVDQAEREAAAQASRIWRAGRAIAGTAAARYLDGRGLVGDFPAEVARFVGARDVAADPVLLWWRWCAIVFPLTDDAGTVRAVQLVALKDDGSPAPHWEHDGKIKITRGPAKGHAIRFPGPANGPLLLAEGPETALSVWLATGLETWANAGGIGRAPLAGVPVGRAIVVCRDDDSLRTKNGQTSPARKALRSAVRAWRKVYRPVAEATPWPLARRDRSDFNDVLLSYPLRSAGLAAVKARISKAVSRAQGSASVPVLQARTGLAEMLHGVFAELRSWHGQTDEPPFRVVTVNTGLGKSTEALRRVVSAAAQGDRVVFAVPTHRLGAELVEKAREEARRQGVNVSFAVWRGTSAENPATGKPMCERPDLLGEARAAMADPKATACTVCPRRSGCAYLQQFGQVATVWLVPTAMLWHRPPAPIGRIDLLVIDEGFVTDGIDGIDGPPLRITRELLEALPVHGSGGAAATADLQALLVPARRRLLAAVADAATGWVERDAILGTGFTPEECGALAAAEWKRMVRIPDGVSGDAMREALKRARGNAEADRMAAVWRALALLVAAKGPERSGRLVVEREGEAFTGLRVFWKRTLAKSWRVPTVYLDATADLDLVRARVGPRATVAGEIRAATPYMHVTQRVGAFGRRGLAGKKALASEDSPAGEGKDTGRLESVWLQVVADARCIGGEWLVICNKSVVDRITASFAVPPFIRLAWFGNLRGLDAFGNVRGLAIVGRPMPSTRDVEVLAGAITGRAPGVTLAGEYYPAAMTTLWGADGSIGTAEHETHPDPTVEKVRRSVTEGELVQAVGRGRGCNRTAANPLAVVVYGSTPLPGIDLAHVEDFTPPDADLQAFARSGLWLESASDMAAICGVAARRIESARERGNGQTKLPANPCRYLLNEDAGNFSRPIPRAVMGHYRRRRRGPGADRYQRIVFDPRAVPNLKAALAPLGELRNLHDPTAPDWGDLQCQVTGHWNFGLAPVNQGDGLDADE
jgi:putative DNA primase/helicase